MYNIMDKLMKQTWEKNLVIAKEELSIMNTRKELIENYEWTEFINVRDAPFKQTEGYCETVKRLSLTQIGKKIINLEIEIEATNDKLGEVDTE